MFQAQQSESGFRPDEVYEVIAQAADSLDDVRNPGAHDHGAAGRWKRRSSDPSVGLAKLRDELQARLDQAGVDVTLSDISMGMTEDWPQAVERGTTIEGSDERYSIPRSSRTESRVLQSVERKRLQRKGLTDFPNPSKSAGSFVESIKGKLNFVVREMPKDDYAQRRVRLRRLRLRPEFRRLWRIWLR